MRLLSGMFGGGGNGAEGRSASACGSTSHELNFDLPNLPWNVWIDGKNLIVRDACNEYVGTFRAESKCLVSDVAKLIEQATRAR